MASKRGIRRKACTGKVQYPDAEAAASVRIHLYRKGASGGGQLNVYKCAFCNQYHIGHNGRIKW